MPYLRIGKAYVFLTWERRKQLSQESAVGKGRDLLYDYCHVSQNGNLSDVRGFAERIEHEHVGDSLAMPMGERFLFTFLSRRSLFSKAPQTVLIDVIKVQRIVGQLTEFELMSTDFSLHCGSSVRIVVHS